VRAARYPATDRDRHGEEATTLLNDGQLLAITVRGVLFRGRSPDELEPVGYYPAHDLARFSIWHGTLCACRLTWRMPLLVSQHGAERAEVLTCQLNLGSPRSSPPNGLDAVTLQLDLTVADQGVQSRGRSGYFESDFLDIQAALPPGVALKACIA
jgi:hypothetical protein